MCEHLLDQITSYYLESRDFNGLPFRSLENPTKETVEGIRELISDGSVHAQFPSLCLNPAIIRMGTHDVEVQLEKFADEEEREGCFLYPSREHLSTVLETGYLADQPYRRLLALGESQLAAGECDACVVGVARAGEGELLPGRGEDFAVGVDQLAVDGAGTSEHGAIKQLHGAVDDGED